MKNVNLLLSSEAERFRFVKTVLMSLIFLAQCFAVFAQQPGDIDLSFGNPLKVLGDSSRFDSEVNALVLQPDGKYIAGGNFTKYNGNARNRIARLNANGTIDNSFAVATGFNDQVLALALQSDGKIIAGGKFTTYNGTSRNSIARIGADGKTDNTFTVGTGFNGAITALTLQSDGKIIVIGEFTSYNGTAKETIARLNTDGTLDNSFVTTSVNRYCKLVPPLLDKDGKIILAGNFYEAPGSYSETVIRLNTNGSKDNTFTAGFFDDKITKIDFQQSGKIIVGGHFDSQIVRLNANGAQDATFIKDRNLILVNNLEVLSNDKIVLTRSSSVTDTLKKELIRLSANGAIDMTFKPDETIEADNIRTIFDLKNGNVLFGLGTSINHFTYNQRYRNGIMIVRESGRLDPKFHVDNGHHFKFEDVSAIALQPSGKPLIGGALDAFNGLIYGGLVRLTTNGQPDTSFIEKPTTEIPSSRVIIFQPDGKILVGGSSLTRLDTNRIQDKSFNIGAGYDGAIYSLAVQPDGKILVGGNYSSYDGIKRVGISRLDDDGVLDIGFNSGFDYSTGKVYAVFLQSDGKILIAGEGFSKYDNINTSSANVLRLNNDGSLDQSFKPGSIWGKINTIALQNDGKILLGGNLSFYYSGDPYQHNGIVRLNKDGSFDATLDLADGFADPSNVSPEINAIVVEPSGKIIVGGKYTEFNQNPHVNLVRLNKDGHLDTTFNIGSGFEGRQNFIKSIVRQPDGKLIIGGSFDYYQGYKVNAIVRLHSGDIQTSLEKADIDIARQWQVYPNPSNGRFTISSREASFLPAKLVLSNVLSETLHQTTLTDVQNVLDYNLPSGAYYISLATAKGLTTKQIIIQER